MNNNLPYQQIDFIFFYIQSIPNEHYIITGVWNNLTNDKSPFKAKLDELKIDNVLYGEIISHLIADKYIAIPGYSNHRHKRCHFCLGKLYREHSVQQ